MNQNIYTDPGQQFRVARLLKHLFREMVVEHDLDTESMEDITMQGFVEWMAVNPDWYYRRNDDGSLCQQLELQASDAELVWCAIEDPWRAMFMLSPLWYLLCLSGRPVPRHKPVRVELTTSFHWDSEPTETGERVKALGVRSIISSVNEPLTDGMFLSCLESVQTQQTRLFSEKGLDGLFEEAVWVDIPADNQPPADQG